MKSKSSRRGTNWYPEGTEIEDILVATAARPGEAILAECHEDVNTNDASDRTVRRTESSLPQDRQDHFTLIPRSLESMNAGRAAQQEQGLEGTGSGDRQARRESWTLAVT